MSQIITINVYPIEESITVNTTEQLVTVNVNVVSGGGISDAPSDDVKYGRKNADWVEINEFSGDYNDLTNKPVFNEHFKGKFSTLSALQTAVPTALDGDYAIIDAGSGSNALEYIWDSNEGWVLGGSVSLTTTDALPEGTSNLYFTPTRAQNAVASQLDAKVDKVTGYSLTKNDFTDALKAKLDSITAIFTTALKTTYDSAVLWISVNGASLLSHLTNTSNPHSTTATQVDALKRDGSNANGSIDIGSNAITAQQFISLTGAVIQSVVEGVGLTYVDGKLISIFDGTEIYKYANGHLTYNETTNSFEWDGEVIAKKSDIPTYVSADRMMTIGRNATGNTLYKGTIIYISGSTGNRPNFIPALADSEATSSGTFGVVFEDIPNNTDGYVVTIGTIDGLDTRSTATYPFTNDTLADGDSIYLSPTTKGYITNVKPSAPNHLVYLGKVVKTNPVDGTIVYRVQNGYELDELHDVSNTDYTTPSTSDSILTFDVVNSLWKKLTLANLRVYLNSFFAIKSDVMVLSSPYVLSNSTSLQKMFNVGSGSGGAFNTTANKTYKFRIEFDVTGMSATTGTLAFGFLGTAAVSSISYKVNAQKATLVTVTAGTIQSVQTTASTIITGSNAATTAKGFIMGTIRCTTAGTLIPALATSIGVTTAQVETNSFFEIVELGANTVTATSNIT